MLKFGRFVYIFVYVLRKTLIFKVYCGERGIRTPGASQHGGFQDRCNRPLYHLSEKNTYPQRFAVLFYFSTAKLVLSSEPTKNYTRFFSLLSFFFVTGNVFFNFAL